MTKHQCPVCGRKCKPKNNEPRLCGRKKCSRQFIRHLANTGGF